MLAQFYTPDGEEGFGLCDAIPAQPKLPGSKWDAVRLLRLDEEGIFDNKETPGHENKHRSTTGLQKQSKVSFINLCRGTHSVTNIGGRVGVNAIAADPAPNRKQPW